MHIVGGRPYDTDKNELLGRKGTLVSIKTIVSKEPIGDSSPNQTTWI